MKFKKFLFLFFIVIGIFFFIVFMYDNYLANIRLYELKVLEEERLLLEEKTRKENLIKYNNCLNEKFNEQMKNDELISLEEEIHNYANNYSISYMFYPNDEYYVLNGKINKTYYAASLYKLLDLIYLIDKNNTGLIDLDNETMTYKSSYYRKYSTGMDQEKFNTKITIRKLLSHLITYSDNTAHAMLVEYIGLNNLRELGKSLGASNVMNNQNYGNSNVYEMSLYLKKIQELINLNNDNSIFIKKIMNNTNDNSLNIEETNYYHKYGMYDIYYHDLGIAVKNDYAVIIMSELRNKNYQLIFSQMSSYFYKLNDTIDSSKQSYCNRLVYGGSQNGQ